LRFLKKDQYLLMAVRQTTANHRGTPCLLHEQSFAGINGSGMHIHWSIGNAN